MDNVDNQKLVSVKEASKILSCSLSKITKLISDGKFPNFTYISKRKGYQIPLKDIDAYKEQIIQMERDNKDYLSVSQMAEVIGCSEITIVRDIKKGKIKDFKVGVYNKYLVHKDELNGYPQIKNKNNLNQKLVSVKEASKILTCSTTKIHDLIHNGQFPNSFFLSNKNGYQIPLKDIDTYKKQMEHENNNYLSVSQMAKIIGCSDNKIRDDIYSGKIKEYKVVGKNDKYIIHKDELNRYPQTSQRNDQDYENLISVKEASKLLSCSSSKILGLINEGQFPNALYLYKRNGYQIPLSDIEVYKEQISQKTLEKKDFLSVLQMVQIIGCSETKIRRDIKNGKIKTYKLGEFKKYLVHKDVFKEYIHLHHEEDKNYITGDEAAKRLDISKHKLYKLISDNVFPNAIIKNQIQGYLLPISEIEAYEKSISILEGYLTVKEISDRYDCHPETVRELIRNKIFQSSKQHIRRSYVVLESEVNNYFKDKIEIQKNYANIVEVANLIGCHKDTIRRYIKEGLFNDCILRSNSEGYLINRLEIAKIKEIYSQEKIPLPPGYIFSEKVMEILGVNSLERARAVMKKHLPSAKKVTDGFNKIGYWIVLESEVIDYKRRIEEERFVPQTPGEFTNIDAVNKMKFELNKIDVPLKFYKTFKIYKEYAGKKLSESDARSETLAKKTAYYIKTFDILINNLPKCIKEITDDDIERFLNNNNIAEYIKQYFIGFIQYCSQNIEGCKFSNQYSTHNDENSDTEIYTLETFKQYHEYVENIELHVPNAIHLKTYAQTWLYVIMHLMNAWRSGDIIYGLPTIDFDDLTINDLAFFKDNRLSREQAQLIVNQVHIKVGNMKISKTGALGQFLCLESLAIPFATAICITELHRRKRKEKLMLTSIRSNGINKSFFNGNEELKEFHSVKMNRTLITYFFHSVSESEGDAHLSYEASQILRSHINEDTTKVYIKFSNAQGTLDSMAYNICERGHFGWVYNTMINLFLHQNEQTLEDRTSLIKSLSQSYNVNDLETYSSFLLEERYKRESLALRLSMLPKQDLKILIIKIFRGEMPAKIPHAQCLTFPICKFAERKTCIGCENIVPTDYLLISISEQINTTLYNLYNANFERARQREERFLKQMFFLINEAINEKGKEYVETFIDRRKIKDLYLAINAKKENLKIDYSKKS
ncbi:helix-turn-helix domain-containing protein [Schinkia azotoformans]|uniref:helix-turn-helix domain-containing protein n=4 Tax=Schinkia azotoformans TaxID=1454 RepID=UPI002DBF8650|nr:helix-turn-helix domain-containing protein [Schinkia azotoformans]MEC1743314.1 helix-turn-helix domain-containing protein [Schinkia azotoformans]MEC1769266.1 helix-turn-helix domain-containing protein [Schinkia azotoformans]MED4377352.1 helix-turn-helix domain-containing protein [Schinkia azotoformans]MED4420189.1 helix-turn-helix domain-containing protein [Schinkia azotoformans]